MRDESIKWLSTAATTLRITRRHREIQYGLETPPRLGANVNRQPQWCNAIGTVEAHRHETRCDEITLSPCSHRVVQSKSITATRRDKSNVTGTARSWNSRRSGLAIVT